MSSALSYNTLPFRETATLTLANRRKELPTSACRLVGALEGNTIHHPTGRYAGYVMATPLMIKVPGGLPGIVSIRAKQRSLEFGVVPDPRGLVEADTTETPMVKFASAAHMIGLKLTCPSCKD